MHRGSGNGTLSHIKTKMRKEAYRKLVCLPDNVFLLPSAPMMTSNSSSLTGCVLGWTSALQPIPEDNTLHSLGNCGTDFKAQGVKFIMW